MKSRLPARKQRAQVARRMGKTLHDMAHETAASDDVAMDGAAHYFLAPVFAAGTGAVWYLWKGGTITLGHVIAIVGAVGAALFVRWLRAKQSTHAPFERSS